MEADVGGSAAATVSKLITHTPAAEVSAAFKEAASAWPLWDSKTHPQKPKNSGKFRFDYNGSYDTERVLITSGSATLFPTDGSAAVSICGGDAVFFHKGFCCDWVVHEPMTKHFAYFVGEEESSLALADIACDECGKDCTAESYLSGELDLCPKCFKANEQKHAGAEKQRFGQPVPEPKPKGKRPASGKAGGKKKK
ncbi:hypothetical protein T492DRAFT_1077705 [Pavlovales sp. CCMP2436]|nr:hypothetical protein T492DRAFT_1077705 [Pavlovales sp. CCMP2436]